MMVMMISGNDDGIVTIIAMINDHSIVTFFIMITFVICNAALTVTLMVTDSDGQGGPTRLSSTRA